MATTYARLKSKSSYKKKSARRKKIRNLCKREIYNLVGLHIHTHTHAYIMHYAHTHIYIYKWIESAAALK